MPSSPSVQRPETIPGRVVGGLYTGNAAELLHLCFFLKKTHTHVSFRGRMGKSGVAGGNPCFLGDAFPHVSAGCRVQSPFGSLLHAEAAGDFGARSPGWVAMGIGGSIPRSDVLFLTLEVSSPGFRALTCLSSWWKRHPLSSSHAVHAAFSVGVYINVLALTYIPKKFQGTISICIQIHI
uniref:Uncharacterized protein n=1 Tax=Myotis myotis TaxID=51298 RepID=A0A7J7S224_MYOMY|nr:hypothetical protein mMyoMyo1_010064 [Myotis myotis]